VTGGGTIIHNGKLASFGFNVKARSNGSLTGELIYIEHQHHGLTLLKSVSIQTLSITGDTGVFTGKAKLDGANNYKFRVTVIDKGEPGRHDKFGLEVTAPNGSTVHDLTFDPITLRSGNIQVPSPSGHPPGHGHDDPHGHDGGHGGR
jgi:hypothetical protein